MALVWKEELEFKLHPDLPVGSLSLQVAAASERGGPSLYL